MKPEPDRQGPQHRRPSRWHRPIWWANGLAVLVLMVTYLAPHADPKSFWMLGLLAMAYPFQLAVQAFFLVWWWFFRRKRMLLSLVALLLGWSHIGNHVQLFGRSQPKDEATTALKLATWNVRLFDLYNWSHNKETRDKMFKKLHELDADILCMQEFFYSPDTRFFRTKDDLMKDFRYTHVHDSYLQKARFEQHFGIATFSVHPIVARGLIEFPDNPNNQCIWSDIAVGGDTIRVYNAHLASYQFGDADYKFIDSLNTGTESEELKRGGLRILRRLRRGFKLRATEVAEIARHMAGCPHPVVYCGDMNDVPMSYSYNTLRDGRRDAFVESGRGTGGTYIGNLPSLRIDHILHDPELDSWGFRTQPEKFVDHHAISCMIGLPASE